MARTSGPVQGNLIPGEFIHNLSHVHCKVSEERGHAWLNFDREGAGAIHGRRELLYFIGSDAEEGRTFLRKTVSFLNHPLIGTAKNACGT